MRSDGAREGFKLGEGGFLKIGQGSPVAEPWGRLLGFHPWTY